MTAEEIRIVQMTWLKVLPVKRNAARLFYEKLFQTDPALRDMFQTDIDHQGEKLMQIIESAVSGLGHIDRITPALRALGQRHQTYGIEARHYGTVGTTLLWTLGQTLGAEFTPKVKSAWATVYGVLAATMQEAVTHSSDL
jgi:hemoglobin-like flavoprotein